MAEHVRAKSPPETEEARPEEESGMPFFPDFALREAVTAFVFLTALIVLAALTKPVLDAVGDPNASGFVPRPEWYFLWLFQMLKYFPGDKEVIGTFFIPVTLLSLVVAVPFLDRRTDPATHPVMPGTRAVRLWPRLAGAGVLLAVGSLTLQGLNSTAPMKQPGPKLTPVQAEGRAFYEKMGCQTCHVIGGEGGRRGPDLTHFASKPDARERVLLHFSGFSPADGSQMPAYELAPEELRALSEYLLTRK